MNIEEHLISRQMNLDKFKPYLDYENNIATFMLYNLSNQIIGFQQYRPAAPKARKNHPRESRYYTYVQRNRLTLFGLETIYDSNVIVLSEGIFDAADIANHGFASLATLSNDPTSDLKNWLSFLNRPVFAVCDSGKDGLKLSKFADDYIICENDFNSASLSEKRMIVRKINEYN